MDDKKNTRSLIINGVEVNVPSSFFDSVLPISPNSKHFDYEFLPFIGLKLAIRPGNTVFDIGSSYSIMSTLISKITGPDGRVLAFEANPIVSEKGEILAEANRFDSNSRSSYSNITYVNKYVGDKTTVMPSFFVVPGEWECLCSSSNKKIIERFPDAKPINVQATSIDDFVTETGIVPDVCKIDVEGAEYQVIKGMESLLVETNHSVDLIVEMHGDELMFCDGNNEGEGNCVKKLLNFMTERGYAIFDLVTMRVTSIEEYTNNYAKSIGHMLLTKKHSGSDLGKVLSSRLKEYENEIIAYNERKNLEEKLAKIQRELIEQNDDYESACQELKELLVKFPNDPRTNYLYALSLHFLKRDLEMAIRRYDRALENGYDEFWVRFNRGSLYRDLGHLDKSLIDLKYAAELKPEHEATQSLLKDVKRKLSTRSVNPEEEGSSEEDGISLPLNLNMIHTLVSNREYGDALLQLDILLESYPNSPGLNYHYAFCLHMMQMDSEKALQHYDIALEKGFDEFWVRLHRGSLLFTLDRLQSAKEDLEQALMIKPNDHKNERKGIEEILSQIKSVDQA